MAAQKNSKAPKKQGPDWRWIFTIFFITVLISAVMSLISTNLLSSATLGVSFVILICIIAIGIVFDIIGVAVTAADEKPFHSMASRKVPEAGEALKLIRNAGRVSSFCNDVIGDICGVISGSASATIAVRVWSMHPGMQELAITPKAESMATTNDVNVRTAPSTNSDVLMTMPTDSAVAVIGLTDDGEWYEIWYNEVCAYLNAKYVKSISSAAPATSEPTTPAEPTE